MCVSNVFFPLFSFVFFRAAMVAYRSSQARGRTGATAAGLRHSHSNTRSELHLRPTPQLMAALDPQPTEWCHGWNPYPHGSSWVGNPWATRAIPPFLGGCICSLGKFLGQRLNWCHSSGNTGSLTCCATRECFLDPYSTFILLFIGNYSLSLY